MLFDTYLSSMIVKEYLAFFKPESRLIKSKITRVNQELSLLKSVLFEFSFVYRSKGEVYSRFRDLSGRG